MKFRTDEEMLAQSSISPLSNRIIHAPNVETVKGSGRDFAPFEHNEAALKIWLPVVVDRLLDEISDAHVCSQSELVRSLLFIHVYGRADFEAMRTTQKGWFTPPRPVVPGANNGEIKYSRSFNPFPELGKNIVAAKIWLPERLLGDIAALAQRTQQKVSPYVRLLLIRDLLGATYEGDRHAAMETPAAASWEE